MSNAPPAPPSLEVLRKEIDAIDEQVHSLLMRRGDIIDRLISVKQTQEVGSAFRPAREADMMRRLVQRHRGILPLDTVESIWRVIISTFTYVQAPFSRACGHSRRTRPRCGIRPGSTSASRCPMWRISAPPPRSMRWRSRRAISRWCRRFPAARRGGSISRPKGAPKIIARLPFIERADHPAALPVFVVSRVADSAMVTEVEMWSVRVSGWNAEVARALSPLAEIVAVPDTAFDGAALLVSVSGSHHPGNHPLGADRGRRLGALFGPRRQPRNALYGDPERRAAECKRACQSGVDDVPPRAEARHSRYCALHPRQEPGGRTRPQGVQAVGQRNPVRPLAARDRGLQGGGGASGGLSGGHLAGAARGDRPLFRARSRPHHLRRRLRRDSQPAGACLSRPRRRGDLHHPRLSGVPDRHHGQRRHQRGRAGNRFHLQCRRHPGQGDAAHQAGVARQPEQPDRHLSAVRRGQAAAQRPAVERAAGARRRLFRLRVAQRLRTRHRAGGDHRQHRGDPHLLQDPRPRRAARSAGCSARRTSSMR